MQVMEAIQSRRSIRKYAPSPVEPEKLARIAEAFRLAPSARNLQNWKLLIIQTPEIRERVRSCCKSAPTFLQEAPVILVACDSSQALMPCGHRVDSVDLSIAMSFAMLEAQELGLGTCWMGSFLEEPLRQALQLPEGTSIAAITPLGYPAESPDPRPRKPAEEVVAYL